MAGTAEGLARRRADELGLTLDAYLARLATEKWCSTCKEWHARSAFGADRSRCDGLAASCREARNTRTRVACRRPNVNPLTGRPGPAPAEARDGDKLQARQRINVEVRTGRRPHPNELPCADCGHVYRLGSKRHEYDHHLGYAPEHHLDVEPVCTTCHRRRADVRGESNQVRGEHGRYIAVHGR